MAQIDELFKIMVQQGASDLHITTGEPPYFRISGEMARSQHKVLSNDELKALIFEILTERQRAKFAKEWELDCSYSLNGYGRFRCNIFMQRRGLGAVFRAIPDKIMTIEDLKLPKSLAELCQVHKGLIVVTGATGSGKSTTLAALIDHMNKTQTKHILTVEDPIEFVHLSQQSLINQREVESHTKSFASALKAALREDPDVILVGEMRDLETIQLAITAAETGHLVFGTLHTNTAVRTIDRIVDVFPAGQQKQIQTMLAESLRAVIAQNLLPRVGGGRVAAIEVLVNNTAVSNLIREGKTFQIPSAMQTGRAEGMFTMQHYVQQLLDQGLISDSTAAPFLGRTARAA
ncbi:MAG: type IV pilus twitching motility protein PilT [Bdellovibrionales bacterium]